MQIKPIAWTERNESLLVALARKVRFLSLEQIARTWWRPTEQGKSTARQQLRRLREAGYLEYRSVLVHPELSLQEPVCAWKPGESAPNFGRASYLCQVRWKKTPAVIGVWVATERAARELGGFSGERIRQDQATHDLHVSSLYCRLVMDAPEHALAWIPEEMQEAKPNERLPDALLKDQEGKSFLAIDFGGACKPARIEKLHAFGERYGIAYELW